MGKEKRIRARLAQIITVISAKAGIHSELDRANSLWVPAFAGTTEGCISATLMFPPNNNAMSLKK